MVCINTNQYNNIRFTHFVEVPRSKCTIGTAREDGSRRVHVFLIFKGEGRIYSRNGLNDTWTELRGWDFTHVGNLVIQAENEHVPCYTTYNNLN